MPPSSQAPSVQVNVWYAKCSYRVPKVCVSDVGENTMPNKNTLTDTSAADTIGSVGRDLGAGAREAKDAMSNMARTAADRLDESRASTADTLEGAASALHKGADRLPGDAASDFAHAAADRVSQTADYVRRNDINRMMGNVETAVKNNPGPALLIAAAFGFFVGRAMMRD